MYGPVCQWMYSHTAKSMVLGVPDGSLISVFTFSLDTLWQHCCCVFSGAYIKILT
jgi:hypothetical protein